MSSVGSVIASTTHKTEQKLASGIEHWLGTADKLSKPTATQSYFITGASGFIGSHISQRLLQAGQKVTLCVRNPTSVMNLEQQGAQVVTAPLSDVAALAKAMQGAQVVIHLAAMTSALSPQNLMEVNGLGTQNVVAACLQQQKPPICIYVSSIAASGPVSSRTIRLETDPPEPVSNYGRSKLAGEIAVANAAQSLPVTIVRPGIVYGPGNREMLPIFQSIRWFNMHAIAGWQTPLLSFSYINDTIATILQAAHVGTRLPWHAATAEERLTSGSGVYFACGCEHVTYSELGTLIGRYLNRHYVMKLPLIGPIAYLAAYINEGIATCRGTPDSFNRDKIQEALVSSWACSGDLARRELQLPEATSLAEGLRQTAAWYIAQKWL